MSDQKRKPMDAFNALIPKNAPTIFDVLSRFNVVGEVAKSNEGKLNLVTYGGRVGYDHPLNNGQLSFGVMGGGARGDYDGTPIRAGMVSGGDVRYANGNDTFSLSHNRMGSLGVNNPSHIQSSQDAPVQFNDAPMLPNLTQIKWNRRF